MGHISKYIAKGMSKKTFLSHEIRKRTFGHKHPAKIQIRLRLRAVWSEYSLGTFWIDKNAKFLHTDNGDPGQTDQRIRFLTLGSF